MRVTYIGVGEAFDPELPNCSVLVESEASGAMRTVLLDCGFTAPFALFRALPGEDGLRKALDLDMIWISHFHGDHFFGLPALLLRFWEEGRVKPLTIVGQPGLEDLMIRAMDMAYSRVRQRFQFSVTWKEVREEDTLSLLDMDLNFAPSEHPQPNLSLRLCDGEHTVFYSGDGRPTEATMALAMYSDLLIHESFSMEQDTPGHGTVPGSIEFATKAKAETLALVHLRRDVRRERIDDVRRLMSQADIRVTLPAPGNTVEL